MARTRHQTGLTILTLIATVSGWLFDRYVVRRHRLSYRVHWNRPLKVAPAESLAQPLSITHHGGEVAQPSFVILRVENVGSFDIGVDDVADPLRFSFGGRRIVHYEVQETDPPGLVDSIVRPRDGERPALLEYHPGEPDAASEGTLQLPTFAMVRKSRFKLLVLLSGAGAEVSVTGRLSGGEVVREGRRGARSRSGLALGGASLLLGGLLVGLVATRDVAVPVEAQIACPAAGKLSVTGSTALYPVIDELARRYSGRCPGAQIQVSGTGSNTALQQLIQGGKADAQSDSTEASRVKLAMADEHADKEPLDPQLRYWAVGVGVFGVVVNGQAGVTQLSTRQLQRLYAGELPRWNDADLGGADRDVVLVSRAAGSGTRDTFVARMLRGSAVAVPSSSDCVSKDIPDRQSGVMHCELPSTQEVLRKVEQTPGAIGYVSVAEAKEFAGTGVDILPVDGYYPDKESVANGRYRFWAVERLYRYGRQIPPTVRDHFVQYVVTDPSALRVLEQHGFYLCNDPAFLYGEVSEACAPDVRDQPQAKALPTS